MRTVVTGGAGFVGSHLTETLISRRHEVVCIERPGAARGWLEGLPVEWSDCGLEDETRLARHFEGADVVFHLAALTEAPASDDYYRVNTVGTARVLRAAARCSTPPRVVFMSTLAAVGPCRDGERIDGHTVPIPMSRYGHSKLLAEAVLHAYRDLVPGVILRFPSVYGPREKAALKLFQMVSHGVALTVGDWQREFSLIYVQDAVEALVAAATSPCAVGRTYCIAHPETLTWATFARLVGGAMGRSPVLLSVPVPAARAIALGLEGLARLRRHAAVLNRDRVREISQRRWVCDPSPAMSEISFTPRFPATRGVPATLGWYRQEGWL